MIKTFKKKELEKLFKENLARGIPSEQVKKIRLRLEAIDSALAIDDLRISTYKLHELQGDRKGTWSIKVTGNWRITFKYENGNAYDVDLEDYH